MTMWRLVDEKTGDELKLGEWRDMIQRNRFDFLGGPQWEQALGLRFDPPSEKDPEGRVWVERGGSTHRFKPAVIRARIIEAPSNVLPFRQQNPC
jgi:hypothetical protein